MTYCLDNVSATGVSTLEGHIKKTELNDLRKNICLKKSVVFVERISECNVIESLTEHGIHCLPFSREATISRLDLSDFSICNLRYSQNRLISFDSRRISEARSYSS